MPPFRAVRHVSVTIVRPPDDVYAFARDPANLPRWARGVATGIERVGDDWVSDSPMGRVIVRFVADTHGILDHDVVLPSGETVRNPVRVVPNGSASEVVFTLFQRPEMSDADLAADAAAVEADLATLKRILEAG